MYLILNDGLVAKAAALAVFGIASLTDYWDGVLARRYNQVTPLGQLLDPIADKVLIFSAFISFIQINIVPAWMVVVMLTREVLITTLRLMAANRGVVIPARKSGKNKTVVQIVTIVVILIFLVVKEHPQWIEAYTSQALLGIQFLLYAAVAITIYSGVRFATMHWDEIK